MLNVWSGVWGGKYPDYYAQRMKREVAANLSIPHHFLCLSDHRIDGVDTVLLTEPWESWWHKLTLFKKGFVTEDENIWIDADCVITGNLDEMVMQYRNAPLAILTNWAVSGHGGCQSSVMIWKANYMAYQCYDLFDYEVDSKRLHGDQEFITELRDTKRIQVTPIDPKYTASYKYHCQNGLPSEDCKIVIFHGKPDPHEVRADWFVW
jgi:hypothetical protein